MRKMNHVFAFIAIVFCLSQVIGNKLKAATYYVAPTGGSDQNPGTISQPWVTWQKAFNTARPGDIVYIRGGIYHPVPTSAFGVFLDNKDGAAGNPIRIFAYPGEVPVMDMSTNTANTVGNYGIRMDNCDYWHLKGLHITGASQHQLAHAAAGILIISGNFNTFELLESYANQGPGMRLQFNSEGNLVLNCDFHDNYDRYSPSPGGNADGIDMAAYERPGNERKNTIRGCRAWHNSDDGFDFVLNSGFVTIDSCWSFNNGIDQGNGSGFKLGENDGTPEGTPQRILIRCLSFGNQKQGFSQNESYVLMSFTNCVAYKNGYSGYFFYWHDLANSLNNCISYSNGRDDILGSKAKGSNNTWNGAVTLSDYDFANLNISEATSPRRPNGSLPNINFLKLTYGSDLIDAGINVGLPFNGKAPDIGYSEFGGSSTSILVSSITVTGTNGAKTISTSRGTLQLSATISPANATNKSVTWSIQNGTGQATISSSGLVTAVSNGTITARATAIDGSGIYGTLIVTISNQSVSSTTSIVRSDGCSITTARSGNPGSEAPAMAFDNLTGTKWYNYNASGSMWIQYQFCNGASYVINSYSLKSANDMPLRDPKTVSISGSRDGVNFTLLDTKTNIVFSSRFQKLTFNFTNSTAYQYYRFTMTANTGNDGLQLSEIELIENDAVLKSTTTVEFSEGMVTVSPNPFREALTIDYNLPEDSHVNLVVYDLNGMVVRQLVNENQAVGTHRIVWDALNSKGNNLHNGIYILKMESAFGTETSKIIYME